jgi:hypothetical protein
MEKITSENHVHAVMMNMMINRDMIRVIDETAARRGKTADTMVLTLWPLNIPTEETIGTMTDAMIIEITTAMVQEEIAATTKNDLQGSHSYLLLNS